MFRQRLRETISWLRTKTGPHDRLVTLGQVVSAVNRKCILKE